MKKGFPGIPGMPGNLGKLMKQAKKMQRQMQQQQETLEGKEYETSAGGGVVKAKLNGRYELLSIEIKPEAVDPDDVEMLQDLIMAAINEGLRKVRDEQEESLSSLTGGMNIPGLF